MRYVIKLFFMFITSWIVLTTSFTAAADTARFDQIVFFGDSLSDNGNLFRMADGLLPKSPPYFEGRFTNGYVWSETVAKYYADKFHVTSKNYAIGGATVIPQSFPPFTLMKSVGDYIVENFLDDKSTTLFVIWIGANDYLTAEMGADKLTSAVVEGIREAINTLILIGAKEVLVMNLPDLAKTPYHIDTHAPKNLTELSRWHNEKLATAIQQLKLDHSDVNIQLFDIHQVFEEMVADLPAFNKRYQTHLTNANLPCWTGDYGFKLKQADLLTATSGRNLTVLSRSIKASPDLAVAYAAGRGFADGEETACAHPDEYVFWDKVHPSAISHMIFSNIMVDYINQNYLHH